MPDGHALSICIGVSACGWPISTRVVRGGLSSRVLLNRAASSDYVTEAIKFCMMLLIVCTAPLCGGGVDGVLVGQLLRKKVSRRGCVLGLLIDMRHRCVCLNTCHWYCIVLWHWGGLLHS
jgi:hypothetical protein